MAPRKPVFEGKGKLPIASTNLSAARAVLAKVFKDEVDPFVEIDENKLTKSLAHLPTGSAVVDFLIGGRPNRHGVAPCPGLPRARITNLYGQTEAGKTTLALTIAARTCAGGGTVCYIDWENAVNLPYARTLGIPTEDETKFGLAQPETFEKGLAILYTVAAAGVDLIVVDSVGAAVPKSVVEQSVEEQGQQAALGYLARGWSAFLPKLKSIIGRTHSCVIGISQLRKAISTGPRSYGDGNTQQGGEAWKFYSDVRMSLRRLSIEKGKVYDPLTHKTVEMATGQMVRMKLDKCKVSGSMGREADFYLRHGEGIDDIRSIIEIAAAHGLVKKAAAWYSWERGSGEALRGCGVDEFRTKVKASEGAYAELYKATFDRVAAAAVDAVSGVDVAPEEAPDEDMAEIEALLTGETPPPAVSTPEGQD